MLAGVEILLERMKTNPEEFIGGPTSKWSRVIDRAWEVLGEEERNALQAGMMEERIYEATKGKRLMQGSFSTTSAIITPQSMIEQVKDTLDKQFDEAYARKDKKTTQTASKLKGMMRK